MPVATTPGPADGDCTPGPADGDWSDAGDPDGSSGGEAAAVNEGPETADSVGGGNGAGVGLPAELHPPAITRRITSVAIRGRSVLGLMDPALRLLIPRAQGPPVPLPSSTALPCTNAQRSSLVLGLLRGRAAKLARRGARSADVRSLPLTRCGCRATVRPDRSAALPRGPDPPAVSDVAADPRQDGHRLSDPPPDGPQRTGATAAARGPTHRGSRRGREVNVRPDLANRAVERFTRPVPLRRPPFAGGERPRVSTCRAEPHSRTVMTWW